MSYTCSNSIFFFQEKVKPKFGKRNQCCSPQPQSQCQPQCRPQSRCQQPAKSRCCKPQQQCCGSNGNGQTYNLGSIIGKAGFVLPNGQNIKDAPNLGQDKGCGAQSCC